MKLFLSLKKWEQLKGMKKIDMTRQHVNDTMEKKK